MNSPQKIKLETRQFQKMMIYLPWILATLQNAEKFWVPLTGLETPGYSQRKSGARSCVTQWRRIACWSLRPRRAIGMASSRPRTEVDWRFYCVRFFCCKENHGCFGGGFNFQRFVMFSPRIFAKMIQFDVHNFFWMGGEKPPTSCCWMFSFFLGVGDGERVFLIGWAAGDWLVSIYIYCFFFPVWFLLAECKATQIHGNGETDLRWLRWPPCTSSSHWFSGDMLVFQGVCWVEDGNKTWPLGIYQTATSSSRPLTMVRGWIWRMRPRWMDVFLVRGTGMFMVLSDLVNGL